jgi:hypothetical protein
MEIVWFIPKMGMSKNTIGFPPVYPQKNVDKNPVNGDISGLQAKHHPENGEESLKYPRFQGLVRKKD